MCVYMYIFYIYIYMCVLGIWSMAENLMFFHFEIEI